MSFFYSLTLFELICVYFFYFSFLIKNLHRHVSKESELELCPFMLSCKRDSVSPASRLLLESKHSCRVIRPRRHASKNSSLTMVRSTGPSQSLTRSSMWDHPNNAPPTSSHLQPSNHWPVKPPPSAGRTCHSAKAAVETLCRCLLARLQV